MRFQTSVVKLSRDRSTTHLFFRFLSVYTPKLHKVHLFVDDTTTTLHLFYHSINDPNHCVLSLSLPIYCTKLISSEVKSDYYEIIAPIFLTYFVEYFNTLESLVVRTGGKNELLGVMPVRLHWVVYLCACRLCDSGIRHG